MIAFGTPLNTAWKRTEGILFRAADLKKWLCLGFTAWLAGFLEQAGSHLGNAIPDDKLAGSLQSLTAMGISVWAAILCGALVVLTLFGGLFIWLGARGQFMFLDNVVANRSEVVRPWKAFRQRGNSLAWLYGWVFLGGMILFGALLLYALFYCWSDLRVGQMRPLAAYQPLLLVAGAAILCMFPVGIVMFFFRELGVPLMYAADLQVGAALGRVWNLATEHPLDFLVYLIVRLVLGFLFTLIAVLLGCLTCCLGFIPYVSTVLTLPLRVFRTSYTLDCLAQWEPTLNFWKPAEEHKLAVRWEDQP